MDFFEAQARAKKRTTRLVLLFTLAVCGTIAAGYLAAMLAFQQVGPRVRQTERNYWSYQRTAVWPDADAATHWWDPRVFAAVALGTLTVVGGASLFKWAQFRAGGSAVAESVNGRRVDPHTTQLNERRLLNVVEEMAIASGVPVPAVYVLDDEPAINAFAAGLTTSDAVVAVTRGALEKLTRDELQGVIGHEFSHILNGDMRLNVKLTAIVFGILVLGLIGRGILHGLRFSRPRGKNSGGVVAAIVFAGVALLVIGYVGYFFGRLIQSAVSRQREFLADASAVQFTRNPAGLAGALRKIGGYALGSSLQHSKSTAIGHFFFSQGFRSSLGGLWATHPPLGERIRAIDPQFDGKYYAPPLVVDIAQESFQTAGFAPRSTPVPSAAAEYTPIAAIPSRPVPRKIPFKPSSVVATAGVPSSVHVDQARAILANLPNRLREASRIPAEATALIYGLLLSPEPSVRAKQQALVAQHAGEESSRLLASLRPALSLLQEEARLPILQLSLPALRALDPATLERFLATLDEMVHVDQEVTVFEFTLQRILIHYLALGQKPTEPGTQIYSFNAVVPEIAIVLSTFARLASKDEATVAQSFAAGAAQLKLVENQLKLLDAAACNFAALDAALDKLGRSSGPIKQRMLTAAGAVVNADGMILVSEAELLRAIAAALDVPLPPSTAIESPPDPRT